MPFAFASQASSIYVKRGQHKSFNPSHPETVSPVENVMCHFKSQTPEAIKSYTPSVALGFFGPCKWQRSWVDLGRKSDGPFGKDENVYQALKP